MRATPRAHAAGNGGGGRVGLTASLYDATRPMTFAHGLMGHPLMNLDAFAALALRRPPGRVRVYNADTVTAGEDIETVAEKHAAPRSLEEMVRSIEENKTYLFIQNVETDPIYGPLVRELLEEVKTTLRAHGQRMVRGWAWVFISAPNTVTPYHRDHEQTCLFQLQGKKVVRVWDPADRDVCSDEENEHFHANWSLGKTRLNPDYESRAKALEIEPGRALFIPFSAPHWVQNGPTTSVSFSVTFATDTTDAVENAYKLNSRLRGLGLRPRPVGESKVRDVVKGRAWEAIEQARAAVGRGPKEPFARY